MSKWRLTINISTIGYLIILSLNHSKIFYINSGNDGHSRMSRKTKAYYIKSSELSEYIFCSVAWYLQRQGYKPDKRIFEDGYNKHIKVGEAIDRIYRNRKISISLEIMGGILIITAAILFLLEGVL